MTSALLFAAGRHEHVSSTIEPALLSGKWVVCDRFCDSMLAYQGSQGIDSGTLAQLNEIACDGLLPDLTLLMRISPNASAQRRGENDYFDRGDSGYLQQVAETFDRLAADNPDRFAVLDAEQPPDRVTELVQEEVARHLPVKKQ